MKLNGIGSEFVRNEIPIRRAQMTLKLMEFRGVYRSARRMHSSTREAIAIVSKIILPKTNSERKAMNHDSNKVLNNRSQSSSATTPSPEALPIFIKAAQLNSLKVKSGIRAGRRSIESREK